MKHSDTRPRPDAKTHRGLKTVKQIHFLLIIITIIISDVHLLIIEKGSLNYDSDTLLSHHLSTNICFGLQSAWIPGWLFWTSAAMQISQFLVILSLDICCWRCISCYHVCFEGAGLWAMWLGCSPSNLWHCKYGFQKPLWLRGVWQSGTGQDIGFTF